MFLVAHLKSVPEENLSTKIKETFQVIDIDGSGELNMQEVRTFLYSFSPPPPASPFFSLLPLIAIASATEPMSAAASLPPSLPSSPSLSLSLSLTASLSVFATPPSLRPVSSLSPSPSDCSRVRAGPRP